MLPNTGTAGQPGPAPHQRDDSRPNDPVFSRKVRIIHRIIKVTHHLGNVETDDTDHYPPSLRRLMDHLAGVIVPAFPSPETALRISGNAKEWTWTTLLILRDHYQACRDRDLLLLLESGPGDWEAPFEVATKWARRNLGRRLQDTTVLRTHTWLQEQLGAQGLEPEPVAGPSRTGPPADSAGGAAAVPAPLENDGGHTRLSVAVMTDPLPCEWSPLRDDDAAEGPAEHDTHLEEPTLILPKKRREKRRHLRTEEDVVSRLTNSPDLFEPPLLEFEGLTSEDEGDACPSVTPRPVEDQLMDLEAPAISPVTRALPPSPFTSSPLLDLSGEDVERLFRGTELPCGQQPQERSSPHVTPVATAAAAKTAAVAFAPTSLKLAEGVRTRSAASGQRSTVQGTTVRPTGARRPTRHVTTPNKLKDWSLTITRKWVILGDSNVARFPTFEAEDLQIDAFPGAKWKHAEALLRSATVRSPVEKIILSFGLNNRSQRAKATPIMELKAALQVATTRFPEARILVPEVNFGPLLDHREQAMLRHLNCFIRSCPGCLPALPEGFATEKDGIHWSSTTAAAILAHWHSVPKN